MPAVLGHEISGTVAALGAGRRRAAGRRAGRRHVHHAVRRLLRTACAGATICATPFFALNRLRGTLYDGDDAAAPRRRLAARDVLDGRARRVRRGAGAPTSSRCRIPAARRVGDPRLRRLHRLRRGPPRRRAARRRAVAVVATGGVGSMIIQIARAVRRRRRSSPSTSATTSSRPRAPRRDRRRQRDAGGRRRPRPRADRRRGVDVAFEVLGQPADVHPGARRSSATAAGWSRSASPRPDHGAGRDHAAGPPRAAHRSARTAPASRADMPEILALAGRGDLAPRRCVTRRFALDEAAAAYEALDRGEIVGRAIVVMPGDRPLPSGARPSCECSIRGREVTRREVVEAHARRIEQANGAVNAFVVLRLDEALAEAAAADARHDERAELPLDGVPISVKETFDLAGYESTLGSRHVVGRLRSETSPRSAACGRRGRSCWARRMRPTSPSAGTRSAPCSARR